MKHSESLRSEIAAKYEPYIYTRSMLSKEYGLTTREIRSMTMVGKGLYSKAQRDAVRAKYKPRVYSVEMCARFFNIPRSTIGSWVKE